MLGDFQYEVQPPYYLLYQNVTQEVNGIWFYNQADCEAVANLFGRWMQMGCFTAHKSLPTQKVHAYFNFRPSSVYLSVNYLDRFLSVYEIPEGNAWMIQLLSIACLFLASKMEETLVPLLLDLHDGNGPKKFLILQSADLILTMIRGTAGDHFERREIHSILYLDPILF